jgi:hypothetical protein
VIVPHLSWDFWHPLTGRAGMSLGGGGGGQNLNPHFFLFLLFRITSAFWVLHVKGQEREMVF